jgi:WD40 repeat protein
VRTLAGHTDGVSAVAVTADGQRAVSASDDRTLRVWDLESGRVIATFYGEGPLLACDIVPASGRSGGSLLIVAGGTSGRVHFLQLEGA